MRSRSFWIATSCSAAVLLFTLLPCASARNNFKTIHRFDGDGAFPYAGLISDSVGNLYGSTAYGGLYGYGTVFRLSPNAKGVWLNTVLYSFPSSEGDGVIPWAAPTLDASGNLYGTTTGGGKANVGTAFKLTMNKNGTWSETVLYSFTGYQDGAYPVAGLISDANGNLFGTAYDGGGSCSCGVVFELSQRNDGSWLEKVIHSFDGADGDSPFGALIFDAQGKLYGTTAGGGQYGWGIVFQLVKNRDGTWKESVLHSFNGKDGALPDGGLIFDDEGRLYSTTVNGGAYDSGVAFKLTRDTKGGWKERILHSFQNNGTDGYNPYGNLALAKNGNLYGTTSRGGARGYGTIFRLTPTVGGQWRENVVHPFRNRPGCEPQAGLLLNPQGILFGTTYGCQNLFTIGSVFQLTP